NGLLHRVALLLPLHRRELVPSTTSDRCPEFPLTGPRYACLSARQWQLFPPRRHDRTRFWNMTTRVERACSRRRSYPVSPWLRRVAALRSVVMRLLAMHRFGTLFAVLALGCAGECAADAARTPDPIRIDVPRIVITPSRATSLPEMFAEAEAKAR